ncbi:hypothetical protein J5Y09_14920 [Roseomonas sp. PWR1]|uniref:Uncharacterized protein n=1 Tax=Roseomonas nitratireducens TaxID=2820810 RepID=A0ABS4AV17_9PROT|nr:hypothetical protein [Neoroseomonas nitratireducens]MBP0465215.1 hypothetical protein [Neoroseomonas nitratireducens]
MLRLIVALVVLLALPARAAETSLLAMLRYAPLPAPAVLAPGRVLLAYARADLVAGTPGPTAGPGHDRLAALTTGRGYAYLAGLNAMVAADWPQASGFDFDAVEAVLLVEGEVPNAFRLLAGARLPALPALGRPIAPMGFAEAVRDGVPMLARGEDLALDFARRRNPEALGGGMGLSLRIAAPAPGLLLATRDWAEMDEALAAAATQQTLADTREVLALLRGAGGGEDGRGLSQAIMLTPELYLPDGSTVLGFDPPRPADDPAREMAAMRERLAALTAADLPPMPAWSFAMLADRREGAVVHTRFVLLFEAPEAAAAGAEAMLARLAAMEAGPRRLGLSGQRIVSEPSGVADLHLAVVEARLPADAPRALARDVMDRIFGRKPSPMAIGQVPRAVVADPP